MNIRYPIYEGVYRILTVMLRPETTTIHSNIQKHENGLSENQGTAGAVE